MTRKPLSAVLTLVGPGILVAATGVGAGDLATAAFTGSALGVTIFWAVLLGAGLKFVLNEGLTRWQLATDTTLLEGCAKHIGWPFQVCFLLYLLPWSYFVGSALVSACGATAHAMLPVFSEARHGKIVFGIVHSLAGLVLIRMGGYRLFERMMAVCIGIMFVTVVVTACLLGFPEPDPAAHALSAQFSAEGIAWTVALMGGVGGTLTVLCYGYWIREEGRKGLESLRLCRIDLGAGYLMTGVFGVAMVVIGSHVHVEGKGAGLIVALADQLAGPLGPVARWLFLLGAWGAVFSSLLGVWQSVPYLFADFLALTLREDRESRAQRVATSSRTYRAYLYALALVPLIGLWAGFREVQKWYAVFGALFMPFLAAILLYLNGRVRLVGRQGKNRPLAVAALVFTLVFFAAMGWFDLKQRFGG